MSSLKLVSLVLCTFVLLSQSWQNNGQNDDDTDYDSNNRNNGKTKGKSYNKNSKRSKVSKHSKGSKGSKGSNNNNEFTDLWDNHNTRNNYNNKQNNVHQSYSYCDDSTCAISHTFYDGEPPCSESKCHRSICKSDPFCCMMSWDELCVKQACSNEQCECVGSNSNNKRYSCDGITHQEQEYHITKTRKMCKTQCPFDYESENNNNNLNYRRNMIDSYDVLLSVNDDRNDNEHGIWKQMETLGAIILIVDVFIALSCVCNRITQKLV